MFSANENIMLRQHKKQIVEYVESTMPEHVLDRGVNVMAMQVSCKMPGCVPLETTIVIIFPKSSTTATGAADDDDALLLPGLPESAGGCYKTKILKPMADVTRDDVLEALPPAFAGGRRSMEKLCLRTRDVMLGQITQLFGDDDDDDYQGRKLMAEYLQQSLQDYIDRGCRPPAWGEAFAAVEDNGGGKGEVGQQVPVSPYSSDTAAASASPAANVAASNTTTTTAPNATEPDAASSSSSSRLVFAGQGNIVIQRPRDDDDDEQQDKNQSSETTTDLNGSSTTPALLSSSSSHENPVFPSPPPSLRPPVVVASSSSSSSVVNSITGLRYQQRAERRLIGMMDGSSSSSSSLLAQLARQHAPGIRRAGCPCCDPDNPSHITTADSFMRL